LYFAPVTLLLRAAHLQEVRMTPLAASIRRFVHDDDGATMPEYALMIALIAVVCIGVVTALGIGAQVKFQTIANAIAGGI
jgi:pilus assembly protein Flp/PilA